MEISACEKAQSIQLIMYMYYNFRRFAQKLADLLRIVSCKFVSDKRIIPFHARLPKIKQFQF